MKNNFLDSGSNAASSGLEVKRSFGSTMVMEMRNPLDYAHFIQQEMDLILMLSAGCEP